MTSVSSPASPTWLTVKQAAEISLHHERTILYALQRGELLGSQRKRGGSWRIRRDDLDAWIRGDVAAVQPTTAATASSERAS